jgi:hypothetical protein
MPSNIEIKAILRNRAEAEAVDSAWPARTLFLKKISFSPAMERG